MPSRILKIKVDLHVHDVCTLYMVFVFYSKPKCTMPEHTKGFTGAKVSYMLPKFYSQGQRLWMHTLGVQTNVHLVGLTSSEYLICKDISSLQTSNNMMGSETKKFRLIFLSFLHYNVLCMY